MEFDIWVTKDDELVVIHGNDGDVSSSTNGSGQVKDLTLTELKELDAGEGERIPTFREVIELCKGNIFMNIEIKKDQDQIVADKVYQTIKEFDISEECTVCSFGHNMLMRIEELQEEEKTSKKIELGFVYNPYNTPFEEDWMKDPNMLKYAGTINANVLEITPQIVEFVHSLGKGLMAWVPAIVEDETLQYPRLFDIGVDIICCNYPNKLQNFLITKGALLRDNKLSLPVEEESKEEN